MVRSVARLSRATSGAVVFDDLPAVEPKAFFKHDGFMLDPMEGPAATLPVPCRHERQQKKLQQAVAKFEDSPNDVQKKENRKALHSFREVEIA